jgi:uncharacterized protein YndB with AHSA1/START domain
MDPRDIASTRTISARRGDVFAAFSDPSSLSRWWGPKDFTNTFHEFDFRAGGAWRFTMNAPNGGSFSIDKVFLEIVEPERIVVHHRQRGHDFVMTITLEDLGEETRVTFHFRFESEAQAAASRAVMLGANEQNFDRLAAELLSLAGARG